MKRVINPTETDERSAPPSTVRLTLRVTGVEHELAIDPRVSVATDT
jgi:hypothetical protein